jgi:acyl-CoA reductase-like NAD-dependent aldehyde dehydrogenase
MHGPAYIFWANLIPFTLQANLFTWHAGTALAEVENIEWVTPQGAASVVQEPIGVVGAITPWNYPLNQIALKVSKPPSWPRSWADFGLL